ncbi:FxLYD domain-containing protein [Pseudomonadota bacterium]
MKKLLMSFLLLLSFGTLAQTPMFKIENVQIQQTPTGFQEVSATLKNISGQKLKPVLVEMVFYKDGMVVGKPLDMLSSSKQVSANSWNFSVIATTPFDTYELGNVRVQ